MERTSLRIYDGVAVTGFLLLPALFTTGLSRLVRQNGAAAWLALVVAGGVMLCLFLASTVLMKGQEGKNVVEVTAAVAGRPLGTLYGVALGGYFCFWTGIQIRECTEILKIYALSKTPLWVVAGLILCAAVVLNWFGGRPIVKNAGFFFAVVAVGILLILLLGLNRYNPDHLVPVLGNGAGAIAQNGLRTASLFDGVMVLLLFAPAFSGVVALRKAGVAALAVATGTFVLLCLCFVMSFSPAVGGTLMSGVMEMGKSSYYNHFFYRFESFLLLFLIFSAVMQGAIGILVARESLRSAVRRGPSKGGIVLCAVLVAAAVALPRNLLDLMQCYLPALRQYSVWFLAGVPLATLLVRGIKRVLGYEKN